VVRRLQHGGSVHFVIDQPDATRGLLPEWMTEPWARHLPMTEVPRLALGALRALRSVVNGAPILVLFDDEGGGNDERGNPMSAARSAHAGGQGARSGSDLAGDRAKVTRQLKRLMTECVCAGAAPPVEAAADE
jgi:hypothetical protein